MRQIDEFTTKAGGKVRAYYDTYAAGCQGKIQEWSSEKKRWLTVSYQRDYPQLMMAFYKLKARYGV